MTGPPSRPEDPAEHGCPEHRGLILVDVLERAGPATPCFEHPGHPGPAARDPDLGAEGHELADLLQVRAEIGRIATDQTQQEIVTRGLERQPGEAGGEWLEGVAAATEVRLICR